MRTIIFNCCLFLFFIGFLFFSARAQSPPENTEPIVGWLEAEDFHEEEIDSSMYPIFQNDKLDLNKIDRNQLDSLGVLSLKQIDNFFHYRNTLGPFLEIYELQAIPLWDLITIERIRKWVKVVPSEWYNFSFRAPTAQSVLTIRWRPPASQQEEGRSSNHWKGDAHQLRALYRYHTLNLKLGLTAEKDPGEYWINQRSKLPADFFSAYVALSGKRIVRQIIVGDYTVNLAQGLIQWQAMNFRKTPQLALLKKNSSHFQVHRSVNEFSFHRGLALQLQLKSHSLSFFVSGKNMSANLGYATAGNQLGITSFNSSGYHRTAAEIKGQGNVFQLAAGGRYSYKHGMFTSGLNFLTYHFSRPFIVNNRSYDQFSFTGKKWANVSLDVGFTYRNFHLFTEQAIDKNGSLAGLAGLLTSLTKTVDVAFLGRLYTSSFQSLYSSAIAEGTLPGNERGFFFGINARLSPKLQLQLFTDYFKFPWLRYLIDQPSRGHEQFVQLNYQADKSSIIYFRFRQEQKMQTTSDQFAVVPLSPGLVLNRSVYRIHIDHAVSKTIKWSLRMEASRVKSWLDQKSINESGFLGYVQLGFRPFPGKFKGLMRLLVFDTDGYQSRIYAFSPGLGGGYQLGMYQNAGTELMLNIENEVIRSLTFQASISGSQSWNSSSIFWHYFIQIALKFHELAPSKIYKPI